MKEVENDRLGRSIEHPNGISGHVTSREALRVTLDNVICGQMISNREKSPSSGCACAHLTLPREPLRGDVTFDDVFFSERP